MTCIFHCPNWMLSHNTLAHVGIIGDRERISVNSIPWMNMDKKSVSQCYSFAISNKTIIRLKSSFFKRRENIQIFHFWMENTLKMCNENWLFIFSQSFFIHSFRSLIHSLHSKEERKKSCKNVFGLYYWGFNFWFYFL